MRYTRLFVGLMLGFGSAALLGFGLPQSESPQTAKVMLHRKGVPLVQLIPPGQPAVTVMKDQSPPLSVEPPLGTSQLEWVASVSPFVLVIHIDSLDSALTPAQDWIKTSVSGRIERVLTQRGDPVVNVGDPIHFSEDGGELTVVGTRVRAAVPWTTSFRQGDRYLVFAERTEGGEWLIDPAASYAVESNARLQPLARRGSAVTEANVPLEVAVARIRNASKRRI